MVSSIFQWPVIIVPFALMIPYVYMYLVLLSAPLVNALLVTRDKLHLFYVLVFVTQTFIDKVM